MTFQDTIQSKKFVVTAELGPPKGIETAHLVAEAESLRSRIDAMNVTDLQSSVMRLGSLAVSVLLKQKGIEPIFQLTCRDRNRLALQSDLLSAAALGIENVLVLTGDHPSMGDHPDAKPVFDLDSVQLLQAAVRLSQGFDMRGNKLEGKAPSFFLGGVVNPGSEPVSLQIMKMKKKIDAGAQFFQTQAVFDVASFERFVHSIHDIKTPVIAGIILLKSAAMARYMNKHVAGITVPDNLIAQMEQAGDKRAQSIEIAAALIRALKPMCQGVHIMPLGLHNAIPDVLEASGL
ncbi:MAG TPA: methylenetetrahydrofolate reductase [Candidatus Omnitrophota bacterium]|nr:methylenetetrahydrofolate reductase [Candidatus Omnitrophota bacterium]HPT06749.1 methylenetetrahydrofolate reductase [Candidatus Omnitrophota bacterium]